MIKKNSVLFRRRKEKLKKHNLNLKGSMVVDDNKSIKEVPNECKLKYLKIVLYNALNLNTKNKDLKRSKKNRAICHWNKVKALRFDMQESI